MVKEYIEQRNGGYFIAGTRVSLDSVVYAFLRGESPEGIPNRSNQDVVDHYLAEGQREFEALRQQARRNNPVLYAKLVESRRRTHTPST